ncbi:MAG: maleylpyruvate isomerase family mycothiol-dependent enzyme [Actinomycetales bacterium]|nr:maleylpyruvate isomerase family mycothiol-dependent enzyme [Actinomycetales bacterium]
MEPDGPPHSDRLRHLEAAMEGFVSLLGDGDLEAGIAACPDWNLADLGRHLDQVHRWARAAAVEGVSDHLVPWGSSERGPLVARYREAADELLAALRELGATTPCWTFGPRPQLTEFWARRQALETAIHLWDAQDSQGVRAPVDEELARDGVAEVVDLFFPRQVRLGRIPPLPGSVALEITSPRSPGDGPLPCGDPSLGGDTAPRTPWRRVLAGDGTGAASAGDVETDATLRGSAGALLLLLWKRCDLDGGGIELFGDADTARAVLSAALTP